MANQGIDLISGTSRSETKGSPPKRSKKRRKKPSKCTALSLVSATTKESQRRGIEKG